MAWELSRKHNSASEDKFTSVLSEARVDLNPHQVEAALFAFRSSLSKGALLADEVGLGKTIEAALVISQKWAERKRHILIICPATLRKQWSMELGEKFYLPSKIMEKKNFSRILNETYSNPFDTVEAIVICSYPFARKNIDHISRVKWDLVVMDEAHCLRNVYRNNNKTGLALKLGLQPFKKILLTATPLQNDIKELYGLISIIDNEYFGDIHSFTTQYNKITLRDSATYRELRKRILPIVHRTLRSQVQTYVKYTNRIPIVQEYIPSDDETALAELINEYLDRPNSFGLPNSQRTLITLILYKLLASSSFAIAGTLETIIERLERMLAVRDSNTAEIEYDFESLTALEEEWIDEENEIADEEVMESKLSEEDIELIQQEISDLRIIHELALKISTNSKGECLLKALDIGFEHMTEMGASRKALIFTESRRTQQYIYKLLEENGYTGKLVMFNGTNTDETSNRIYSEWLKKNETTSRVTGSKTADKRQALVDYFRNHAEIMIATEAAAEGINLQFCSLIVNYDLPWNPQRVEQRIGRCHRYGQKNDVVVVNFLNKANHADQRVYELLDQKFNLFKGVFGASDEVLGTIGNGIDFEKRILAIYRQCRNKEEIDQAFDALQEEFKDNIQESLSQTRLSLFENFDEEVVEKLRLRESEESDRLNAYTKLLWELSKVVLTDYIKQKRDKDFRFFLDKSPIKAAPRGIYSLSKDTEDAYRYGISHPLAQWVIATAKKAVTPNAYIIFDYTGSKKNNALLRSQIGHEGYIIMKVVRFYSLREDEEHILLRATDTEGRIMEDSLARRILSLPIKEMIPECSMPASVKETINKVQNSLIESLEIRNSDILAEEIVKIENWAEDSRKSLQQKLNELDKAIDLKNEEFIKERNIRKKLAIQKEKDFLNERRETSWREYDDLRIKLKDDKKTLIQQLYEIAEGKIKTIDEFTIKWKIV